MSDMTGAPEVFYAIARLLRERLRLPEEWVSVQEIGPVGSYGTPLANWAVYVAMRAELEDTGGPEDGPSVVFSPRSGFYLTEGERWTINLFDFDVRSSGIPLESMEIVGTERKFGLWGDQIAAGMVDRVVSIVEHFGFKPTTTTMALGYELLKVGRPPGGPTGTVFDRDKD